jgi:hypothetical protein
VEYDTLDELIARWEQEDITAEEVIGLILQQLRGHNERLRALERALRETAKGE